MQELTVKVIIDVSKDMPFYPLVAYFYDPETLQPMGQEVRFRDMNCVRSYFNGWVAALYSVGVKEVTLTAKVWPYATKAFRVGVNPNFNIAEGAE